MNNPTKTSKSDTYSSLVQTDNLVVITYSLNEKNYGYYTYLKYLQDELPDKNITVVSITAQDHDGLLPLEYFCEISNYSDLKQPYTVLLNMPLHFSCSSVENKLKDIIKNASCAYAVMHDTTLADNYLWRKDALSVWQGTYGKKSRVDIVETSKRLLNKCTKIIFPSKFLLDYYNDFCGSFFDKVDFTVVGNPYLKTLEKRQKVQVRKNKVIMYNSMYKQDLPTVLHHIKTVGLKNYDRVLLLNSELWSEETSFLAFSSILTHPKVSIIYNLRHDNILNLLQFVVSDFYDFGVMEESFGYMAREALFFGCNVQVRKKGAFKELPVKNVVFLED